MSKSFLHVGNLPYGFVPDNDDSGRKRSIIFVHGIRSEPKTFDTLQLLLTQYLPNWNIRYGFFSYDYRQSIPKNGVEFAQALIAAFQDSDEEVTIIGHSMGGLVSRLALLQHGDAMPFVKKLVMLATPNHGTLHTGRHGVLTQLVRESLGVVWGLTTKATGVKELTEIGPLLDKYLTDSTISRTFHVDFISIPAECFHENRSFVSSVALKSSRMMSTVPLFFEFLQAHPGFYVGMGRPHDGIVEESSVCMGDRDVKTRVSERCATFNHIKACGPYVHARHKDMEEESHVTIQSCDRTAIMVSNLLKAENLSSWQVQNERLLRYKFEPNPQP